jgi:hypothetical protein
MQSTPRFFAMALTAAGLLLMPAAFAPAAFAPAAFAQDKSPAPSPAAPGRTTTPTLISDSKLDATAAAVKRVTAVKETYDQKMAKASGAEKERLVTEATNAMTKAVTDQGLSIEEYGAIIQVAQNDPVVREKLIQRLK